MRPPRFFTILRESFRAKLFSLFAIVIVVISFSFTIFFVIHEKNSYLEQLVNEGNLLARLLAYNSRLAVFAENREALQAAAEGVSKNDNVKSVAIFASDGGLLAEFSKSEGSGGSAELDRSIRREFSDGSAGKLSPEYHETADDISFYTPIISEVLYPSTESLYFKEKSTQPEYKSIGLVRIVLGKADLKRRANELVVVGAIFLAVFLILGIFGAYNLLKGITKPLNRLMEGVRTLGEGDLSERVAIETADEIGEVAIAFNAMAETLERREAEKAQLQEQLRIAQKKEAQEEWDLTFDTVTDLVAIIDRNHRIVQVNEAIARRFSISKDEAVGKSCYELFHNKGSAGEECPCVQMLMDGKEHEAEFYEKRLDSYFWVTVTPLRKKDGELFGCIHVARDITEWKRGEEEKKAIQAKLIQTNKMTSLGLLVSGMAHEVNNPNNSIKFTAHVLTKTWDGLLPVLDQYYREEGDFVVGGQSYSQMRETLPQLITGITESSRKIEGIIKNLRDFVHKGKSDMSMQVDINRIVSVSASILNSQIKMHTNHFKLDLLEGVPNVMGNSQQLEQVIINLIMNALQALPDKERSVRVESSFDEIKAVSVIKVSDEGEGMPEEVRNRLFEPFFSTKLARGGTGLGLAISNVIVKDHGGVLEFESEPGRGTTAIVRLPVG
jgi:PAS domain S-box-containing protein